MAEHSFQEVMKQVYRMCRAHSDCKNCPLDIMNCCGNIGSHCCEPLQAERIERATMQWAEEHPEPVYETWFEYLLRIGVIPEIAPADGLYQCIVERIKHKPIPADIAEKLGLEPKNG